MQRVREKVAADIAFYERKYDMSVGTLYRPAFQLFDGWEPKTSFDVAVKVEFCLDYVRKRIKTGTNQPTLRAVCHVLMVVCQVFGRIRFAIDFAPYYYQTVITDLFKTLVGNAAATGGDLYRICLLQQDAATFLDEYA